MLWVLTALATRYIGDAMSFLGSDVPHMLWHSSMFSVAQSFFRTEFTKPLGKLCPRGQGIELII
jgi:hypothetical protein